MTYTVSSGALNSTPTNQRLSRLSTTAAAAGGFAAERWRVLAAAAARRAGRINSGPTVRRSNILIAVLVHGYCSHSYPGCTGKESVKRVQ